jgi:hypothetical protein
MFLNEANEDIGEPGYFSLPDEIKEGAGYTWLRLGEFENAIRKNSKLSIVNKNTVSNYISSMYEHGVEFSDGTSFHRFNKSDGPKVIIEDKPSFRTTMVVVPDHITYEDLSQDLQQWVNKYSYDDPLNVVDTSIRGTALIVPVSKLLRTTPTTNAPEHMGNLFYTKTKFNVINRKNDIQIGTNPFVPKYITK